MAKKSAARKSTAKKAAPRPVAVTCQCESPSNNLGYGLIIGTAFGVLAGTITGNYALWLPICIALGLAFGQFFKC